MQPPKNVKVDALPSDDVMRAVGFLFTIAGGCEMALAMQVMRLMSHPDGVNSQHIPAVSGLDVTVKLGIVRTYIKMLKLPHEDIFSITDEIQRAYTKRNFFAHSVIAKGSKANTAEVRNLKLGKDGDPIEPQRYTPEEIENFGHDIFNAVRALDAKLSELGLKSLIEPITR